MRGPGETVQRLEKYSGNTKENKGTVRIQMNSGEKEKQWKGHGTEVKHNANGNWEVFNETRIKVMV